MIAHSPDDRARRRGRPGRGYHSGNHHGAAEDRRNRLTRGPWIWYGPTSEIEHRLAGNSGGGALLREQAELCVLAHGQEPARPRENQRDRDRHRRPYRPPLPAQREIDDHGRRDANSDVADQDASCEDESQNHPGGHTIAASGPDSGQDREQLAQEVKRL